MARPQGAGEAESWMSDSQLPTFQVVTLSLMTISAAERPADDEGERNRCISSYVIQRGAGLALELFLMRH